MTGVNLNHIFAAVIAISLISILTIGVVILLQPQPNPTNPTELNDMPPLPPDTTNDFPPIPQDTPIPTTTTTNTNNNQQSNDIPPLPQ